MPANDTPKPSIGSATDRRRSSSSANKFAGLMNQKRNSTDETAAARKASFAEQAKAPGFVGGLWNSFTKGSTSAEK
ncbi:MAG: hypothetical protein FRX48_08676 [Lasallia pustulata]|uniref:Conidiation-specific expression n=1 Tax=Lasallia pustulata TaxID=136370 RepID=A0A5M8PEC8_9LECA|nr:MAG: hypothetical protein FRX48_08676 [Lasallia pustulata]